MKKVFVLTIQNSEEIFSADIIGVFFNEVDARGAAFDYLEDLGIDEPVDFSERAKPGDCIMMEIDGGLFFSITETTLK